jgi:hypothetical protein
MRGNPHHNGTVGAVSARAIDEDDASDEEGLAHRYKSPLTLAELTYERCKVARELLALDYRAFLEDLDTNEACPDYLAVAATCAQNAIVLWEATVGAWRRGRR